jgi:hypothetical protein
VPGGGRAHAEGAALALGGGKAQVEVGAVALGGAGRRLKAGCSGQGARRRLGGGGRAHVEERAHGLE